MQLWRTSVACWFFFGKTLLCLIFFLILFWGCIHYKFCSVTLLILCNIRLIHAVSMMLYCFDFCELLFLSLVGIMVCGCNQILQICGCRLFGGGEFLIFWGNLDWLLPAVVIFLIIECGIICLLFIVLLWSGFWSSEWISMHRLLCY